MITVSGPSAAARRATSFIIDMTLRVRRGPENGPTAMLSTSRPSTRPLKPSAGTSWMSFRRPERWRDRL